MTAPAKKWIADLRLRTRAGFDLSFKDEWDSPALALFGPSGAGKTTILEILLGLRPEAEGFLSFGGEVWLESAAGIRVPPARRRLGWVPQEVALFPHLTAEQNILLAAHRAASSRSVREWAAMFEIEPLLASYPAKLSGGEAQRVALARALAGEPKALLLDEPFSSLDRALKSRVIARIAGEVRNSGTPIILVSHDSDDVRALADEVISIENGQAGAPEKIGAFFSNPAPNFSPGARVL